MEILFQNTFGKTAGLVVLTPILTQPVSEKVRQNFVEMIHLKTLPDVGECLRAGGHCLCSQLTQFASYCYFMICSTDVLKSSPE